jgi:single-strand DNA-binding protein
MTVGVQLASSQPLPARWWTPWTPPQHLSISLTKGARIVVTGRLEQRSWETDDGETRTKVELVADDIGASLRFATVDIHKVQRHASTEDTEPSEAVI